MASVLLRPWSPTHAGPASAPAPSPAWAAAMLAVALPGSGGALEAKASTTLVAARRSLWLEGVAASMAQQGLVVAPGACTGAALVLQPTLAMDTGPLGVALDSRLGAYTKSPSIRVF